MMQNTQQATVGVVTQPQGVPVTFVTQNHGPAVSNDKFGSGAAKQMLVLSSVQVAMAILCIIFGSVLAELGNNNTWSGPDLRHIGYGIWVGLFYAIVGGIGIGAAKKNSACLIISSMVLHIICSVLGCATLVVFSSFGLIMASTRACTYSYHSLYGKCKEEVANTFIVLNSLMIIMGLAEFVITIWGAILCCGAVCRCCKPGQRNPMVQYSSVPTAQHPQVIVYPGAPMTTYTTYPVAQGQQMAYPTGVYQPTGYVAQTAQPADTMASPGHNTAYMSQAAQPVGYTGQPSQPPHPGYPQQQALPFQSESPPAYQAVAADQPPPAAYLTKS